MRAFLVGSSPHSLPPASHHPQPGDWVLAADGGAALCLAWGWPVDGVVGDLDSLDVATQVQLRAAGVAFWPAAVDKDETDLELALHLALARGAHEIIIAGALGARIDHTLGNLALLALPALAALPVCVADGRQTVWLTRGHLTLHGRAGDTVSLLPFGGHARGVSLCGVRWPLHRVDLPLGPSLTISNRLTADRAEISVQEGMLLVVLVCQE